MRKITIDQLRTFAGYMSKKHGIPMYRLKSSAKRVDYVEATSVIAAIVLQRWYRRLRAAYKTHVDPITLEAFTGPTFHVHKGYRFDPRTLSQHLSISGKFRNICTNQPFTDEDLQRLDVYNAQMNTGYPKFQYWHTEISKRRAEEAQILETVGYLNQMIANGIEGIVQDTMNRIYGAPVNYDTYDRYVNDIVTYGYALRPYDPNIRGTVNDLFQTQMGLYRQRVAQMYMQGVDTTAFGDIRRMMMSILDVL